jgi:hypothetical protein
MCVAGHANAYKNYPKYTCNPQFQSDQYKYVMTDIRPFLQGVTEFNTCVAKTNAYLNIIEKYVFPSWMEEISTRVRDPDSLKELAVAARNIIVDEWNLARFVQLHHGDEYMLRKHAADFLLECGRYTLFNNHCIYCTVPGLTESVYEINRIDFSETKAQGFRFIDEYTKGYSDKVTASKCYIGKECNVKTVLEGLDSGWVQTLHPLRTHVELGYVGKHMVSFKDPFSNSFIRVPAYIAYCLTFIANKVWSLFTLHARDFQRGKVFTPRFKSFRTSPEVRHYLMNTDLEWIVNLFALDNYMVQYGGLDSLFTSLMHRVTVGRELTGIARVANVLVKVTDMGYSALLKIKKTGGYILGKVYDNSEFDYHDNKEELARAVYEDSTPSLFYDLFPSTMSEDLILKEIVEMDECAKWKTKYQGD